MDGRPTPLDALLEAQARRFEVQRCLGSGGFGEVYLATMVSPAGVRTEVAVKVLHAGLDPRSQAVQRLRDEGRLLGTLNHPCVLKVHDLVMLGERVALVMEYVPGLDLDACLDTAPPVSLRGGLEVIARVADALHAAWTARAPDGSPLALVHRDIKPSNIRVGQHGEVKLLDFGIAKAADARREAKTQTRVTIGSPWYMSPERFDGVSDRPPADVYALGCTLYELVAGGQRLFDALSAKQHFLLALDAGAHDAHVTEHLSRVAAPAPVVGLLREMLAWDGASRPTAEALGPALDELVERLDGANLRRWCREVAWPDPPSASGSLDGQVLTEHRISGLTTPDTPAPAPPRPRPEPELGGAQTFAAGQTVAEGPAHAPSEPVALLGRATGPAPGTLAISLADPVEREDVAGVPAEPAAPAGAIPPASPPSPGLAAAPDLPTRSPFEPPPRRRRAPSMGPVVVLMLVVLLVVVAFVLAVAFGWGGLILLVLLDEVGALDTGFGAAPSR